MDDTEPCEEDRERYASNQTIKDEIKKGVDKIFNTIKSTFLAKRKVVLLGDFNNLKNKIIPLMDSVGATWLPTHPSYSAIKNNAESYNDMVFYKGLTMSIIEETKRKTETSSDHNGITCRISNSCRQKGSPK